MTEVSIPAAGQVWDAKTYAMNAGFVPDYGDDVMRLLAPQRGERILDLGCGDGVLTERLAGARAEVTGLEPDPSLAAAARLRGLRVLEQDAHDPFGEGLYDAVFSNAALHWMRDPAQVLANVFKALRPGGRLVAEQGGFGNVAAVRVALDAAIEAAGLDPIPCPWGFPTLTLAQTRLETAGFAVTGIALIPRPTPLPTGAQGWLKTFGGAYLSGVDTDRTAAIIEDAARRLDGLRDETGVTYADYVRLRFVASKP